MCVIIGIIDVKMKRNVL